MARPTYFVARPGQPGTVVVQTNDLTLAARTCGRNLGHEVLRSDGQELSPIELSEVAKFRVPGPLTKTYLVFWTFSANHADRPARVEAPNPKAAIMATTGYLFNADRPGRGQQIRYLVFEVGGDLVHDGPCPLAADPGTQPVRPGSQQ